MYWVHRGVAEVEFDLKPQREVKAEEILGKSTGKFREIKIQVTPENSAQVQKKLFEKGCEWIIARQEVKHINCKYLFVDSQGKMTTMYDSEEYFNKQEYKEMEVNQILDPNYEIKLAWAKGETVQYQDDGWKDWNLSEALILDYYEWRIKPKTRNICQWERQFETNGLIVTLASHDNQDPIFKAQDKNWMTEVYGKEYKDVP